MYHLKVRKSSSSDIRLGLARPFLRANCLVIWHVLIFLGLGAFDAVSVSEKIISSSGLLRCLQVAKWLTIPLKSVQCLKHEHKITDTFYPHFKYLQDRQRFNFDLFIVDQNWRSMLYTSGTCCGFQSGRWIRCLDRCPACVRRGNRFTDT
jgi:hypothetical protein